jgi:diguanylate cyclase (GGDEF)-like protein
MEAVEQGIARARRLGSTLGVLFLDLDHFKDVNDTLGHPVGDQLLISVAERLQASTRRNDIVARLGGDEFAMLVADLNDISELAAVADKIIASLSQPHLLQRNEVRCGTSIGIDVLGPDAPDGETLLAHADVALYRAKTEGRGTYRFFTDAMNHDVAQQVALNGELRAAIDKGELYLVYQPQIEVDSGAIVGVEALVRWSHPTRGTLLPGEFIAQAERSGLITSLGRFVLREACGQMRKWIDAGIAPARVAVNVSGVQFKAPQEFEADVAGVLAETNLPSQRLELEITEAVLMTVVRSNNEVLSRLRRGGVRIAIDDFGTGYSSLHHLSGLSVDRIKVAQKFTMGLDSWSSLAIVKAAIGLASDLGLEVLVEGAETAEQVEMVKSWGCRQVQGFFFGKPMQAAEITKLLRDHAKLSGVRAFAYGYQDEAPALADTA